MCVKVPSNIFLSGNQYGRGHHGTLLNPLHSKMISPSFDTAWSSFTGLAWMILQSRLWNQPQCRNFHSGLIFKSFKRYLESRQIPYYLPKSGIRSTSDDFQSVYTYNPIRFRQRGSKKWLTMNELKAAGGLEGKYVEVATSSFNEQRQSQPSEFYWDDRGKGSGFKILKTDFFILTILCLLFK